MTLPIVPVVIPADLVGQRNGQLPTHLLVSVDGGGRLHHLAARAWRALVDRGWREVGLPLTFTHGGTYRSLTAQETLFRSRYTPNGPGGGCKTWNGQRWCKRTANLATAAVPGTSNHGWGLAIDCAWDRDLTDGLGPDDATAITSHPGWEWLLANAHRFGFSWELQSEPWHLRYVTGDAVPVEVLAFERPSIIDQGDDMRPVITFWSGEPYPILVGFDPVTNTYTWRGFPGDEVADAIAVGAAIDRRSTPWPAAWKNAVWMKRLG